MTEGGLAESMAMGELLRPPGHRGPTLAAGGVMLTLALLVIELRWTEGDAAPGTHLALLAVGAALLYGLGYQFRTEGGQPLASASVLLVSGLLLCVAALARLAEVLGATGEEPVTYVWAGLLFAALAAAPALRRNSAACALLAALALVLVATAAYAWLFDADGVTPYRWVLLACAIGLVFTSLVVRGGRPRHGTQMANAAGLAILAIGLIALASGFLGLSLVFGDEVASGSDRFDLPGFWRFVLVAAGCGLVADGALDRQPGPVVVGMAVLATFVVIAADGGATLEWWPLVLLVLGGGLLAFGLRPRPPLPPEPGYGALPVAARTADEESVVRLRHEE